LDIPARGSPNGRRPPDHAIAGRSGLERADRTARTAAGVTFLASLLLLMGTFLLGRGNAPFAPGAEAGSLSGLAWAASWLGFGAMGVLLIQRLPRNPIGWLLLGIPLVTYTSLFLEQYAVRGLVVRPGSLPLAIAAGWVSSWLFVFALGAVMALMLVYPHGRIRGAFARRVGAALATLVVLFAALLAVEPTPIVRGLQDPSSGRSLQDVMNPVAVTGAAEGVLLVTQVVGTGLALLAVVVSFDLIRRWRRSSGIERLQFRWFAVAVAALMMLFLAAVVVSDILGVDLGWNPDVLALFLGMNAMAAAIGVAVSRYRLWELDRLVNRTLVYAGVTVVLATIYALGVVVAQALLPTGGSDLVVAGSTLAVAALFGPLRRQAQRLVDRHFDRARHDAHLTIATFTQRLRDEIDLDALAGEVQTLAMATMRPRHVSMWLRTQDPLGAPRFVTIPERPPENITATEE
jgi:hypothetical protein